MRKEIQETTNNMAAMSSVAWMMTFAFSEAAVKCHLRRTREARTSLGREAGQSYMLL